mgnify:FL=1
MNLIYRIAQSAFIVFITTSVSMPLAHKMRMPSGKKRRMLTTSKTTLAFSALFKHWQNKAMLWRNLTLDRCM